MSKVTYKSLFDLNITYLNYLIEKSYLSHQYLKNITESGSEVESQLRKIFTKILPRRYKVTHGYIAIAKDVSSEPLLSPQLDMIIVDTLVPHSLFMFDEELSMEVVPLEAVVGIFEIKRTLNKTNFESALNHLSLTQQVLDIKKNDSKLYSPTGTEGIGMLYSNPLLGIIGLSHEEQKTIDDYKKIYGDTLTELIESRRAPDLDLCSCLGNFILGTCDDTGKNLWAYTLREDHKKYQFLLKLKSDICDSQDANLSQAYFLSITLGFILYYFSNITGHMPKLENYFFNHKI